MIEVITYKLGQGMGTQVAFINNESEKTFYAVCFEGQDLQDFINTNTVIAQVETL